MTIILSKRLSFLMSSNGGVTVCCIHRYENSILGVLILKFGDSAGNDLWQNSPSKSNRKDDCRASPDSIQNPSA